MLALEIAIAKNELEAGSQSEYAAAATTEKKIQSADRCMAVDPLVGLLQLGRGERRRAATLLHAIKNLEENMSLSNSGSVPHYSRIRCSSRFPARNAALLRDILVTAKYHLPLLVDSTTQHHAERPTFAYLLLPCSSKLYAAPRCLLPFFLAHLFVSPSFATLSFSHYSSTTYLSLLLSSQHQAVSAKFESLNPSTCLHIPPRANTA